MTTVESELIAEANKVNGPWALAAFAIGRWGMLTFGVASLLVMNEMMFKPQMQSNVDTIKALQDVVVALRETAEADRQTSMRDAETAASLRLTAEIFNRYLIREGIKADEN